MNAPCINPFATNIPLEARWLEGGNKAKKADFLACPLCGFTAAIVAESEVETYLPGSNEPLVHIERKVSMAEGYVKTQSGIYKFPKAKKRLRNIWFSLKAAQLPVIAECPNQKCKRQIIISLHPPNR